MGHAGRRGAGWMFVASLACKPAPPTEGVQPAPAPVAADPRPQPGPQPPQLPVEKPPRPEKPWVTEPLGPAEAAAVAQAAGMKPSPPGLNPVRCPPVEAWSGPQNPLAASGPLAALGLDFDGFLRPDAGLAQVVALLGEPGQCTNPAGRDMFFHLKPRDPKLLGVMVTTFDLDVTGVTIRFAKPFELDGAALTQRHGQGQERTTGPNDTLKHRYFEVTTKDFQGSLIIGRSEPDARSGKMRVNLVIARRIPAVQLLPHKFETEGDVVRLATLALWPGSVPPYRFYTALGRESEQGEDVTFTQETPRNIASAALKRTTGNPSSTRSIDVTFSQPIAIDVDSFAETLAAALHARPPSLAKEASDSRIRVREPDGTPLGDVILRLTGGRLTAIEVTRAR